MRRPCMTTSIGPCRLTRRSLSRPDEIYSVIAWLLFQNQIIAEDAVIDAQTLPKVQMPNRNGFIPDPRPDVR